MMKRAWLLLPAAVVAAAQSGTRDGYFARFPFDEWVAAGEHVQIHWLPKVTPPALTVHQRLSARVEVTVEAKEVERRRGQGEIVTLVQIEDTSGHRWRAHGSFSLTGIPQDARAHGLTYGQEIFVLPGDYKISIAACDSTTGDYSFTHRTLHVAALRSDPLPAAWRDLQTVELMQRYSTPDYWFQPFVRGRIKLPLNTRRPVHLDVIVNMTPSERLSSSVRTFRRNMSVLVPALKLLSDMQLLNGTVDIALLDLTRRKMWEQKNARGLDWSTMREPFANMNPGVIDAQSLAVKGQMKQFFWEQVIDRLKQKEQPDSLRVVIVLSAPVFLDRQFKVEPASYPRDRNRRVFYMKVRPLPPPRLMFNPMDGTVLPPSGSLPGDDLEHTLRSLDTKVYSSIGPEEFRKALASMMAEVQRM